MTKHLRRPPLFSANNDALMSLHESSHLEVRRSTRLKNREFAASKTLAASQPESPSAPRTKKRKAPVLNDDQGCDVEPPLSSKRATTSGSDIRRSQRITTTELDRREKRLLHREQDLKSRSDDLEERILSFSRKEDETAIMMLHLAEREKEGILKQLDEYFTCSLCYDILAAPYSLNPSQCGHTFCGICILKWFFSRLHRACGAWHESVDCPICRSLLIMVPDPTPRLQITFPFIPNRVTDSAVEGLVEKLAQEPLCSQAKIKREDNESTWGSQSRKDRGKGCVGKKRETLEGEEMEKSSDTMAVDVWREGGDMRAEWLKKDREGKREMEFLLKHWPTMASQDFVAMKMKLGV
ncbi:hypothetical protein M413DRAFT_358705 [Hebeloma cylindrosporum]|uniref:RING-type domain-containing protein n=1 Tax=Hebeloma cylindrosporum TaxID=76867 RepID=A0A0C2Y4A3_HEBCY|nr:hypothetical protein M413DRAFT_358705 [Hebeloma cylindrosporum h7]